MNKLTEREKILIFALLIFAIIVGGIYFLITPAATKLDSLQEEINYELGQKESIQLGIASLMSVNNSIAEKEAAINTLKAKYYSVLTNDRFDVKITGLMLKHDFFIESISMTDVSYAPVLAYGEASSETADPNTALSSAAAVMYVNKMNISASAPMANIVAFIDEFAQNTSMRITRADISASQEGGTYNLQASIDIYMLMPEA